VEARALPPFRPPLRPAAACSLSGSLGFSSVASETMRAASRFKSMLAIVGRSAAAFKLTHYRQLGFDVGGKRPTTSSFSLRGKKIEVDGSVKKGQVVVLRCEVRIGGVHFDDQVDSATQEVVGCTRKQVGRIVGVSRIE
jgi:hypothetical protein